MTAHQLAIQIETTHPGAAAAMGYVVGGQGSGHKSLARYVALQLSERIGRHEPIANQVEGAFLSNVYVSSLTYASPSGGNLISSHTGSGLDLSMFRLTPMSAPVRGRVGSNIVTV